MPQSDNIGAGVQASLDPALDDPSLRLELRERYYERYGFGRDGGYGASELKFLQWEVSRGVLNPLTSQKPGSRWWRDVNAGLIYDAEYAARLFETNQNASPTGSIGCWLSYLREPSPRTWYRAHNASIASGYLIHADSARQETRAEQIFINIVLYRVLYAQAMVEGGAPGLMADIAGAMPVIGRVESVAANPKSIAVDLMVHLPSFYPQVYPLPRQDITRILGLAKLNDLGAQVLFDQKIVNPGLGSLYQSASTWLDLPALRRLVTGNTPIYPNHDRVYQTMES